jgi:uncharacterized membrane protein YgaE (UPF0421/DUF939 family)
MTRLRGRLWPIFQTALAATAAWYAAVLLLPDGRPSFASIAAVICLGASYGQRGSKALQLVAGVVVGICVASAIAALIGAGSLQIGLMVVLAMSAAVLLGGGELLTAEAAVSAILLVSLDPSASDASFTLNRILEGLIGGGVALAVTSLFFPPDPTLHVGRAAQAVFAGLGAALQRLATALTAGDARAAGEALAEARGLDALVDEFGEALATGRETARLSPRRRAMLADLDRYAASFAQVDFAVRDTRVLARHSVRLLRAGDPVAGPLPEAVTELGLAVWALAGAYDQPDRADAVRGHALRAGALASEAGGGEVAAQIRSTAVDLRRAADLLRDAAAEEREAPTEELLAAVEAPTEELLVPA